MDNMTATWLAYARTIIASKAHMTICERSGGAAAADNVDTDLRWPGMLGLNYSTAKYRILCVGQIHLSSRWSEGLGQLQPVMRHWISGNIKDEEFFCRYNDAYAKLLPTWGPWTKAFGPVLSSFGIKPSEVVYTNFARCWQTSGTRVYDAMNTCSLAFPISALYDIVKPEAVLALSGESVFRAFPALMNGIARREWQHFPGRRSFAFTKDDIELMTGWLRTKLSVGQSPC